VAADLLVPMGEKNRPTLELQNPQEANRKG
jgi:hypothetical protein